ncbi:MAG: hypothetical protein A3H31_05415 [Gallionellales bacterium RIFCSPLOWO2_02_FULL_57_47]|nr:MAG: hypothetical protein A3H31_05415 [Gallionellales bacterium RIFCSPLOWO2_02_FULL_57_47]OGT08453.1 MAG: hypothetical protein A3J49_10310 [Gallionellales bacterium RIFCSPHIGHO2_02_FULL_57_16]
MVKMQLQQRPVDLRIHAPELSIGAACRAIYFGADLNSFYPDSGSRDFQRCFWRGTMNPGGALFAQMACRAARAARNGAAREPSFA